MNIAIIPARGGSKRIPNKNIKKFCGKPIIAYSIEVALNSGLFDQVIVSTDSQDIADVALQYGAQVPFLRPLLLSDDITGTTPVVVHAIEWLEAQGHIIDNVCCIYATAPFLQPQYLKQGIDNLAYKNCDFSFSAASYPFPIQRAIRILSSGGVEPMYGEHIASRSQDLEPAYHDAGQFYWGTCQSFKTLQSPFTATSMPVILPRHLVQDIDTLEDWICAERLAIANSSL